MSQSPKAEPIHTDEPAPLLSAEDLQACGYQLGFGTVCGYASGFAMKKFGAFVAFTVGSGFIALQSLQYMGYLNVNWRKVERDYTKMMDLDGDGVITANDVNLWHHKVQDILKFDLPAGLGFTSGWILGIGGPGKLAAGTGVAGAVYGMGARVLLPRVAATTAATTGGPAVVVTASEWWEKAKTTLGVPLAPEEQFRKTLMDYDYGQLKKLQQQLQRQEKAKEMLTFDAEMLAMKQRVVEQRLEVVPPPPAPWWKLW